MTKMAGSGSISQRHGCADPDPHQNVMDPEDWLKPMGERSNDWRKVYIYYLLHIYIEYLPSHAICLHHVLVRKCENPRFEPWTKD
jgi:hypothetical protein